MLNRSGTLTLLLLIGVFNCVLLVGLMLQDTTMTGYNFKPGRTNNNARAQNRVQGSLKELIIISSHKAIRVLRNSTAKLANVSDIGTNQLSVQHSVAKDTDNLNGIGAKARSGNVSGIAVNGSNRLSFMQGEDKPSGDPGKREDGKMAFTTIRQNWSFNSTAADEFRSHLEKNCNTSDMFLLTQDNVQLNEYIPYEAIPRARAKVKTDIYQRLPQKMPYQKKSFNKCSLVGNSGVLLGSKCGQAIDKADFVIRYNLPGVLPFSEDVGSKTDFITCNPTILRLKYEELADTGAQRFLDHMTSEYPNATVYFPAFSYPYCKRLSFKAQDILNNVGIKAVFPHPVHMELVRQYWRSQHNIQEERSTTGLILFTAAMSICEEIHLYGYWPFSEDPDGKPLLYHYHDEGAKPLNKAHHDIPAEFQSYVDLHNNGVIRLHVTPCGDTS